MASKLDPPDFVSLFDVVKTLRPYVKVPVGAMTPLRSLNRLSIPLHKPEAREEREYLRTVLKYCGAAEQLFNALNESRPDLPQWYDTTTGHMIRDPIARSDGMKLLATLSQEFSGLLPSRRAFNQPPIIPLHLVNGAREGSVGFNRNELIPFLEKRQMKHDLGKADRLALVSAASKQARRPPRNFREPLAELSRIAWQRADPTGDHRTVFEEMKVLVRTGRWSGTKVIGGEIEYENEKTRELKTFTLNKARSKFR